MRLALDAFGGDSAPEVEVEGALEASEELDDCQIVLVGQEERLREVAARYGGLPPTVTICHASQAVEMDDSPVEALRRKPDSSIAKAIALLATGEVDAVVSAGNTGAVVALATLRLGLLEGVRRPGIAVTMPTINGSRSLVVDCGANVKCKPQDLLDYGVMASAYCRHVFRVPRPRVGLLNIGEEPVKGNELVKAAHRLFESSHLNYIGYAEGRDIFTGVADVVVCEGFVGNVLLKVSEGMADTIMAVMKEAIRRFDSSEFGGAPLLGVNGTCMICHGSSDGRAVAVALRVAAEAAASRVNDHIVADLRARCTT